MLSSRPAFAWKPVTAAVFTSGLVMLVLSGRYGYHRDELYFRMLPAAWGYADQPPLTPMLARLATSLFSDTVWAMRLPALLAVMVFVLLTGLIARELGGDGVAQGLAAWGAGFAALPMAFGHILLTASIDLAIWAAVLLCVIRALGRDPRWWLATGAAVGFGLYNKFLLVVLLIAIAAGMLVSASGRAALRSPWLWGAVVLALIIGAPNIIYQITHDWPQLAMAAAIEERGGASYRLELLPWQLLLIGPPTVPIWIAGLVGLTRSPQWRSVQPLGWAYPIMLAILLVVGGQMYYPLGLVSMLFAAGCVRAVEWSRAVENRRRLRLVVGLVAANAAVSVLISLPVLPISVLQATPLPSVNPTIGDQVGWPEYTRQVAEVYQSLPAEDADRAVIITDNYGEAGAIAKYGPEHGLPPVYSGHNELYFQGQPPADVTVVVVVGIPRWYLDRLFDTCTTKAKLANGTGIDNEEEGRPVVVCSGPRRSWNDLWPDLQHWG